MNRQERRYGRMYLLPLLLGLTGIALLVLEWVLRLHGADTSGALDAAMRASSFRDIFSHTGFLQPLIASMRSCLIILVYPAILLVLYLIRIPSKYARILVGVSLAVALFHVAVVLYVSKHMPTALCLRMPGYNLLSHIRLARVDRRFLNVLTACSDGAFVLSSVSTVFTTALYCFVKARSDRRNAAFDQRNAYLINAGRPKEEPVAEELPDAETAAIADVTDEPTRVLELPEDL